MTAVIVSCGISQRKISLSYRKNEYVVISIISCFGIKEVFGWNVKKCEVLEFYRGICCWMYMVGSGVFVERLC